MRQRYLNIICCVLAFLMTFTGMCMDKKQADSFFECSTLGNHSSAILISKDDTITSEEVCTQRMLGISESTFIKHVAERNHIRTKVRSIQILIIANLCSQGLANLHKAEDERCFLKASLQANILNYIHAKDGKK